jgi:hypothetical protein
LAVLVLAIGSPVWTAGNGLETLMFVGGDPASPREAVPFEAHEVVGFVKTGLEDLIDVIVFGGTGFP